MKMKPLLVRKRSSTQLDDCCRVFCFIVLFFCLSFTESIAQAVSQEEAVAMSLKNNRLVQAAGVNINYFKELKKTGTDIGKLSAVWTNGQYNSIKQDDNFTLTQAIPFPSTLIQQVKLGKQQVLGSEKNLVVVKNEIAYQVKLTYEQLLFLDALRQLLLSQDSIYQDFSRAANARFKSGESNLLEKTTAETQALEVQNQLTVNTADTQIAAIHLQGLLKSESPVYNSEKLKRRILTDSLPIGSNPKLNLLKQQLEITEQVKRVEKSKLLPDLSVGVFSQSLTGFQNTDGQDVFYSSSKSFQGFQLGLSIPIWIAPNIARAKSAAWQAEIIKNETSQFQANLESEYAQALHELKKNQSSLAYYENSALQNATLIITQSRKAYKAGEIGYVEYLQSIKSALSIKLNHLQSLTRFNQSILKIEYLQGKL